ncbi:MAG: Fic family protein [Bdellovibrionales bacterium]|nr:Fic family protein [Bdellovibrionales bacterium]
MTYMQRPTQSLITLTRSFALAIVVAAISAAPQAAQASNRTCSALFQNENRALETIVITASELLPVTPENFANYEQQVVTIGRRYVSSDRPPLSQGQRYHISPELPGFMLFRKAQNGIVEMRGFGARSRFFQISIENESVVWTGIAEPQHANWTSAPYVPRHNPAPSHLASHGPTSRENLARMIVHNTRGASRTIVGNNRIPSEQSKVAEQSLKSGADYIITLLERKQPLTIRHLEELHALVARGALLHAVGDLALGMLRGSPPRLVHTATGSVLIDMSQTSVRMGDQIVVSYTAAHKVRSNMQKLLDRINAIHPGTPPAEVAAIYTEFLATHPFLDGNGRTSRILLQYMQLKMQVPLSSIDQSTAFMAFYLTPVELAKALFKNADDSTSPPRPDAYAPGAM